MRPGICNRCGSPVSKRQDDSVAAISKRLDVFSRLVAPVISFYRDSEKLEEIDGARPPDAVFSGIMNALALKIIIPLLEMQCSICFHNAR